MVTTVNVKWEVILTWTEVLQGAIVGVIRRVQNLQKENKAYHGVEDRVAWQVDIEGALGEMAVAKVLDRCWSGQLGKWRADDVGEYQVRTASNPHDRLNLHEDDSDTAAFILCIGQAPAYRLAGWIEGANGKQKEHWKDPTGNDRAAFFVPQARLKSMESLLTVDGT